MKSSCLICVKFWFFRNYWWVIIIGLLVIVPILAYSEKYLSIILTSIGVLLGLFHFIQKQKLDEMRLCHELFKDFNARYNELNDELMIITKEGLIKNPDADCSIIIDYFNLCGEEYFYYSRGYIDPVVWKAWRKGMMEYLENPEIKRIWNNEKHKESYYGLSF